ncbi:hypothetical protein ABK040_002727 [Willaertia magna]
MKYIDSAEILIFKIVRILFYNYVEGRDEDLKGNVEVWKKCYFLCKWFGRLLNYRYPSSQFAYYIHIMIVHLPLLIYKFGNLSKFANQDAENIHSGHLLSLELSTVAGKSDSEMKQILLQSYKKLYLSCNYKLLWLGGLVKEVKIDLRCDYDENEVINYLIELEQLDNWEIVFERNIEITNILTTQPIAISNKNLF